MIDLTKLKLLVLALEPTEDELALDRALSDIDIEIYNLRTQCFPSRTNNPRLVVTTARDLLAKLGFGPKPQPQVHRRRLVP